MKYVIFIKDVITIYYLDYHLHSFHSFDGKSSLSDMCRNAAMKGLNEICFTEHFSVDPEIPTYGHLEFDKYSLEISKCRELYSDKLIIKKGLEICETHLKKDILLSKLADWDLDFIIGSIHNINKLKLRNHLLNKGKCEAYREYFEEVYKTACYGEMDILGHLDLLKRYAYSTIGNYSFFEYKEIITEILKKLIDRNIGIEVNTSGLRAEFKEPFPSTDIIKLYKDLGGEIITIGSDSHNTEFIGYGYYEGIQLLKNYDYEYIFTFEKRKPFPIKIK